ncbi:hypothetical protein SAMN05216388_10692 [Halorientalis persicus]|uniref:Uncharacterized protein n=1 Tax=Halorientalis persicus TaxID=1367881 RepID=A0A1H8WPL1_9EURY|nr:hypothetical protein SAMN05216388_10692 [Halorientalis persicus]
MYEILTNNLRHKSESRIPVQFILNALICLVSINPY